MRRGLRDAQRRKADEHGPHWSTGRDRVSAEAGGAGRSSGGGVASERRGPVWFDRRRDRTVAERAVPGRVRHAVSAALDRGRRSRPSDARHHGAVAQVLTGLPAQPPWQCRPRHRERSMGGDALPPPALSRPAGRSAGLSAAVRLAPFGSSIKRPRGKSGPPSDVHGRHAGCDVALARRSTRRKCRIEIGEVGLGEHKRDGADIVLKVFAPFRARDGHDVLALGQHPGQGQLCRRGALAVGDLLDLVGQLEVAIEVLALEARRCGGSRRRRDPRASGRRLSGSRGPAGCRGRSRCRARGRSASTRLPRRGSRANTRSATR